MGSLNFTQLLQVVFSSQQRLNRPFIMPSSDITNYPKTGYWFCNIGFWTLIFEILRVLAKESWGQYHALYMYNWSTCSISYLRYESHTCGSIVNFFILGRKYIYIYIIGIIKIPFRMAAVPCFGTQHKMKFIRKGTSVDSTLFQSLSG